ncbi:MAG TPA: tRNA (adenosine(37)-N6)-threonylcarbamoyltransferase complex dimerization subunit type 1 TsaB [Gammaproteobacteria bacterium]|nr:tRNA (adenosine(37)-N6)-threonylcarbamoyltransferase complex dimerization subunit type 1 TsaB [Gammaproteobacteria bacterium]
MKILAIDTATEACSAALYIDGELTSRYQLAPRQHSQLILKMIDDLLAEANTTVTDLDAIAFGRGPGSFMGLRIAAGVVQGIAFAYDIPVVPVSTLKAIAQRAYEETGINQVMVAIDARMQEVYWCPYRINHQQWLPDGEEQVIAPGKIDVAEILARYEEPWVGAGTGWGSYADSLLSANRFQLHTILAECLPSAEAIAKLAVKQFEAGHTVSAAEAIPVYLRNDVARKPKPIVL